MTLPDSARVEPEQAVPTTVDELAPLYRQMLAIRRMEEAAAKAYSQGKIGGFLHLIIGQEAVCVGSIAALKPDDYVVATYREHGVGLHKMGFLEEETGAGAVAMMRSIKQALDPDNIMNPGKIFTLC